MQSRGVRLQPRGFFLARRRELAAECECVVCFSEPLVWIWVNGCSGHGEISKEVGDSSRAAAL